MKIFSPFYILLVATCIFLLNGCSNLSPEAQESIQDFRATLPGALRGDARPLEEYPRPNLSGGWSDENWPDVRLVLNQTGDSLNIERNGTIHNGGGEVEETFKLTVNGRAIKGNYITIPPGKPRAEKGPCTGASSVDSNRISLQCTFRDETTPYVFVRR